MPFYPGISKYLTNEQIWTILCADPSVKLPQLAAAVGALPGTVNRARWRLRKYGWTCRVSYGVCRYCGKPFTRQGPSQLRRSYHPACHPVAVQHNRRAPDRWRWEALPVEVRWDHLAGAQQHSAEHQKATKATATKRQVRWTPDEDAVLIARPDAPAHVLAHELQRTLHSVERQRGRLCERGLLAPRCQRGPGKIAPYRD